MLLFSGSYLRIACTRRPGHTTAGIRAAVSRGADSRGRGREAGEVRVHRGVVLHSYQSRGYG